MDNAETQVTQLCKKLNIPEPIEFLTKIMSGSDPRRIALVYLKIKALEEEYGDQPPDEYDWLDLVEMIKNDYRGSIVEIAKSQDAAKQLLEYMHPKRKAVEKIEPREKISDKPLNRRQIRLIKERFDLDY
jgi:hypothetical protein